MTESGNEMVMPVAPMMGGYGNGGFGNWGSDIWVILLVLFAFGGFGGCGWGGMMNGMGWGGFGGMYEFPWLLNGQNGINANTNAGFNQLATANSIDALRSSVASGFGDVQLGIAGVNQNICQSTGQVVQAMNNGFNSAEVSNNARQMANMQQAFAAQTAMNQGFNSVQAQLAQCCCDNRAATQDVKYTIATEACSTRAANAANTQSILDKLCQLELDSKNTKIADLERQLTAANLAASQVAQTAEIRANNATVANQLVAELRSCPIPSQPVYGNQPIFTCGGTATGCACGAF